MTEGTAPITAVPGSFRDPSGFLFERDGTLYRQVNHVFAEEYDAVVASGLYDRLHADGLLIAHDEVDRGLAAVPEDAHRVLRPDRVPFVSYPYEWCPGQRRAAALLSLRIQDVALDHGMTLRDASAFNVQFVDGRPVLIDTLSFGPYTEGEPWVAYRQFCQHFLAPLALETTVDVRLGQLLTTNIDGIPLDLAAGLLPFRTKLRPALLTHVHGQARASRSREADPDAERRTVRFSERAMRGLVDQLRGAVTRLTWDIGTTTWGDYYDEASHYSDEAMASKVEAVGRALDRIGPRTVWDLGANTGRFSRLAAERGADVVAFDVDHGAVERAWHGIQDLDTEGSVLPLVLDLSVPTPPVGWAHTERESLAERGPVDLVMALALVHHLAIGNNVPLPRVLDLLGRLGEHVLVEWVPKDDPKVRVLLATREDVFDDYRTDAFEEAVAQRFEVLDRTPVAGSHRVLFLLRRR